MNSGFYGFWPSCRPGHDTGVKTLQREQELNRFFADVERRALRIAELSGDPNVGEPLYNEMCSRCHGVSGRGGAGLNLIEHRDGHEDAELIDTVLEGGSGMPSFKRLEDQEIAGQQSFNCQNRVPMLYGFALL